KEAWENLRKRRMTMELSMTLALIAALCIGQFLTALVIAFFVLFAELVEGYTVGGGRRAIQNLIDALPRQVRVRRGGQERELGTSEVAAGETIIIRPGERIPADGVVSKGHSFVDQSSITGESLPIEKVEQSKVFAGTINKDGVLEVIVEKIGTLTLGVPEVTAVRGLYNVTENEVLQTAAIAEQHSEHPLGEAIVRRARERKLPLREYSQLRYAPGKGIVVEESGARIMVG